MSSGFGSSFSLGASAAAINAKAFAGAPFPVASILASDSASLVDYMNAKPDAAGASWVYSEVLLVIKAKPEGAGVVLEASSFFGSSFYSSILSSSSFPVSTSWSSHKLSIISVV